MADRFPTVYLFHVTAASALDYPETCVLSTHTGVLLEFVQEVLGWNEVVEEVAETVLLIG